MRARCASASGADSSATRMRRALTSAGRTFGRNIAFARAGATVSVGNGISGEGAAGGGAGATDGAAGGGNGGGDGGGGGGGSGEKGRDADSRLVARRPRGTVDPPGTASSRATGSPGAPNKPSPSSRGA